MDPASAEGEQTTHLTEPLAVTGSGSDVIAGNGTATNFTSMMNGTTDDSISVTKNASSFNVTDIYDIISSANETLMTSWNVTTSDVISVLNTTASGVMSSVNGTAFSVDGSGFNVTNSNMSMTTAPFDNSTVDNTTASVETTAASTVLTFEQEIADFIDFWIPPFLFFIGTFANILVIMVMQHKDFRHMSTSFYMSVSSSVDMASLLVSLPAHYLYVNFPWIFDSVRDAHVMCSFFNLFGWGSSDMGVLLTVAMTTERSLAIQFPLRAPTLCTVKRAKIVTVCLFLLELLKVGQLIFTSRVSPPEVTAFLCYVDLSDESYRIFYTEYWPYIHNIFLVVSFIIIIIGNVIITVHVKRSEDSKDIGEGAKTTGGGNKSKVSSKSRQLSLMLIIDSATIVICTLPFSIYVVIAEAVKLFDDTPQGRGESSLVFAIVFYLLYVNRCANFFLYCVSGARFRQTLKDILTGNSAQKRKKKNYITGITNTRSQVTSSTFSTDGEPSTRVSMNPLGSNSSNAEMNGESGKRISTISMNTLGSPSTSGSNGLSKLERHYGYGKTQNGGK